MSVYCQLDCDRRVDARNHNLYRVGLTLKNPNDEEETISWTVTFPPGLRLVKPHSELTGVTVMRSTDKRVEVAAWIVDVSPIPELQRAMFLDRSIVEANVMVSVGTMDHCATRITFKTGQ